MTILLISGQKSAGKTILAKAIAERVLDLNKARLTHPISYPKDLSAAIDLALTLVETVAVDGLSTTDELFYIRREFPEQKVIHFHLIRVDEFTEEEGKLADEADYIMSCVAKGAA